MGYVVKMWKEKGATAPEPFKRHIKIPFAPDIRNVPEITLSYVLIYPGNKTDYHKHDRPELIIVAAGKGICVAKGKKYAIEPDMAIWAEANEMHQIINPGHETIKLFTVFVPGYTAKQNLARIMDAAKAALKKKK